MLRALERFVLSRVVLEVVAAIVLGLACLSLLRASADVAITVLAQHTGPETGFGSEPLAFHIGDTVVFYGDVLEWLLVGALGSAVIGVLIRRAKARSRECPECRSVVPSEATVCRYCSSDLAE